MQQMHPLLEKIVGSPFVPTILPFPIDLMARYVRVLVEEGIPVLEVLCRPIEDALELVEGLNRQPERSRIALGLGTVLTEAQARRAVALSPDFLVSPAFSRRVLDVAVDAGIPYIPGVCTFQDVQDVQEAFEEKGLPLEVAKLCPVTNVNAYYVSALSRCYAGVRFCPTGDPDMEQLQRYAHWKRMPGIVAPMGVNFASRETLERGDVEAIRKRIQEVIGVAVQIEAEPTGQ